MFANTQANGELVAIPDVLDGPTPAINHAENAMATGGAERVLFGGGQAHHVQTRIPISTTTVGALPAPPNALGITSRTQNGPANYVGGSASVLVDGQSATRLCDGSQQNTENAVGGGTTPSQLKVQILAR